MEARAARFDEEDELKKLRTQVNFVHVIFINFTRFHCSVEGSRKKF